MINRYVFLKIKTLEYNFKKMNNKNKPKLKMEDFNKSDFIKTLWNKGSNKIILIQFKKMMKNVELKD